MAQKRSIFGRLDSTGVPLLLIRLALGGFFAYSAVAKIVDEPSAFLKAVKMYNVLPLHPPHLVNTVAIVVPWLELICGLALVLGVLIRGASLTILLMLCVFTPALYMYAIKLLNEGHFESFCDVSFDCGCGTGVEWMCCKIPSNLALLVLALLALLSKSRRFCLTGLPGWLRDRKAAAQAPADPADASA